MAESAMAQGAAAGSAFGPWGAAAGALLGGASDFMGSGSDPGGTSALHNTVKPDFGGFNVTFGDASPLDATKSQSDPLDLKTLGMYALVAVAGLFALKLWKKAT